MVDADELSLDAARWLVSDAGLDAVAEATAVLDDGVGELALVTRLRASIADIDRRAATIAAARARLRARALWPDADRLLFTRTGLEQASDPRVSAVRAARFAGVGAVEDRACGIGGDTLALAAVTSPVVAIDRNPARLALVRHNASVRELDVEIVEDDAARRPPPLRGPVHVDPSRRVGERRVRRLAEHQPSVPALLALLRPVVVGAGVAVVLSPAVDLDDPDLPADVELEFVQVGGDLVEAVAWSGALRGDPSSRATATLLDTSGGVVGRRSRGERRVRVPSGPVRGHLVEVAPAAVRARLHDEVAAELGARRVATRRALLTVDDEPAPSPWWRARRIETVLPLRAAAVRRWLQTSERPVELVRHGVDVDLDRFRREIGSPPGGPRGWRVELVRTDDGAVAVVTDATDARI